MPLEHAHRNAPRTVLERRTAGQERRKLVPRSLHATWTAPANRPDPVQAIIDAGRHKIASLLPIRYGRMRQSPLNFLRGTAGIMACDLAHTPASGLHVQACGDAHLANFGVYASPEGTPVFDVNDFDETLPAPFEWDLKRLATSFAVAARSRGLPDKNARQLARTATLAYRTHMSELMRLAPIDVWQSRIDVADVIAGIEDSKLREREMRRLEIAMDASRKSFPKLLEKRGGALRIRDKPPLVFPLGGQPDDTHEIAARTAFDSYRASLPEDRKILLDRYRLADVAFKVVGIGSVGTFCAIGLFLSGDGDPLLLQIKEADASALAPYAGPSAYANGGQRVVTGQRLMQAVTDVFLGWTQDDSDLHCYVRQLKDPRLALVGSELVDAALPYHATLCGRALARGHARSGDPAGMAGFMGSGGVFDAAIADFALAYADQTERDWKLFLDAINEGHIEARTE